MLAEEMGTKLREILMDCLYRDEERVEGKSNWGIPKPVLVEGVVSRFGFHPGRLDVHCEAILEFLHALPNEFQAPPEGGGGWSFLNACMTKDGEQWGGQKSVDELMCLGMAIGHVKILLPRDMWGVLPGGVPYFSVC